MTAVKLSIASSGDRPALAAPLPKGQQTRAAILDAALALASQVGLRACPLALWPNSCT